MWLLPMFPAVARIALRGFYQVERSGPEVPARGPVLLVANHPNSLLDPASVVAIAGRPVRFLAKAPLFTDPAVGWLIRAAAAIPVYRRSDDPDLVERNDDSFRAACDALAAGSAVGIFPEGLSHSEPEMAPLRTGAARIALGALGRTGGAFPIVPVGLSFPRRSEFRSRATLIVGEPVPWDDLAAGGARPDAVRELTARIDRALRAITVNLERWEDAPIIASAEAIYSAERDLGRDPGPADAAVRITRQAAMSGALRRLRREELTEWTALATAVETHARRLARLRVSAGQLRSPEAGEVIRWLPTRAVRLGMLAIPGAIGIAAYSLPYLVTRALVRKAAPPRDVEATYKVLVGTVVHLGWTVVLASAAGAVWGGWSGLAAIVGLPLCGLAALALIENAQRTEGEATRFVRRLSRPARIEALRRRQSAIARQIDELRARLETQTER